MIAKRRVIELSEHASTELARAALSDQHGEALWQHFAREVDVEFPSPKTGGRWRLTPKGWVGFIPLAAELGIALRPKVPVRSVFAMLEHAYDLKSFRTLEGLHECGTLEELYEKIAALLARRVRARVRRGLHRTYEPEQDRLPYLRGKLDARDLASAPWRAGLSCRFEEHTGDTVDNQLLLWGLHHAATGGICATDAARHVIGAYRSMRGAVSLAEHAPTAYVRRRYNRLNDDYAALHGLARFIVENAGPRHTQGDRTMIPFLLDMNQLFEKFVAAWLRARLPENLALGEQANLKFGDEGNVRFVADLVIRDAATGRALIVVDTKYKEHAVPAAHDVQQVVAYAHAFGASEAALVYPMKPSKPWEDRVGDVRVRTLSFPLDGDVDEAGGLLLESLLAALQVTAA